MFINSRRCPGSGLQVLNIIMLLWQSFIIFILMIIMLYPTWGRDVLTFPYGRVVDVSLIPGRSVAPRSHMSAAH